MAEVNLVNCFVYLLLLLRQGGCDGQCGPANNRSCTDGACCSQYGYCGLTDTFCTTECQRRFGRCFPFPFNPSVGLPYVGLNPGRCGSRSAVCPDRRCCSVLGHCGDTTDHCEEGCQPFFGRCNPIAKCSWPSPPSNQLIFPSKPLKQGLSNQLFYLCQPGFISRHPVGVPAVTCSSNWPASSIDCVRNLFFNQTLTEGRGPSEHSVINDGKTITCKNVQQTVEVDLLPFNNIEDIRILLFRGGFYRITVKVVDVYENDSIITLYGDTFDGRVNYGSKVVFPAAIAIANRVKRRFIQLNFHNNATVCELEAATTESVQNSTNSISLNAIIGLSVAASIIFSAIVITLVLCFCLRRSKRKRAFVRSVDARMVEPQSKCFDEQPGENTYEELDLPILPPRLFTNQWIDSGYERPTALVRPVRPACKTDSRF